MARPLRSCPVINIAAVIAVLIMLFPAQPRAQQSVGVVTAIKGDAQLTRGTDKKPLQFRDDVVLRDIVNTQEKSLARILFGGSSTVTVRELSTLEVTEEVLPTGAKRTVYDMSVGAILVRVINKLMGPGDEVQIKTPNAIAAVRGTTVFTRCLAQAARALRCTFSLLAGNLTLNPYGKPPFTLTQNTSVSITGNQATGTQVSPITPLTTAEAQQILADSGARTALEGDGVETGIAAREMQQATQLASTLVGSVTPPIPPVNTLQPSPPPAPVVAGGQGQAVDEAAGPTFPLKDFPVEIIDQADLQLDEQLAVVEGGPFEGSPLIKVTDSNITGPTDGVLVNNANVQGGVIASDPVTFNFGGNYILVTGEENIVGFLATDDQGTFGLDQNFLQVSGNLTTNGLTPAVDLDQSTITTGNSLIFIDGTASLSAGLLEATDTQVQNVAGDFLEVDGTLTATGPDVPVLNIDPTTVTTTGNFIGVNGGGTLVTAGQLVTDIAGTYSIGENFLHVGGTLNSTTAQPALELSGSTVSTGNDFAFIGSDGTVNLDGSLLDATNSDLSNIGGDFVHVAGALTTEGGAPLLNIDPSSVTTAGDFVAVTSGGNASLGGQLLTDAGGTYNIGESVLNLEGSVESSTALPLVRLSGTSITTGEHFIDVSGGTLVTQGDILEIGTGSSLDLETGGASLLSINGGAVSGHTVLILQTPVTTAAGQPALNLVAGSLNATGSLAVLSDNLTLQNSFLSQSGGSVDVSGAGLAVGSTTLFSGPAPVFDLTGGTFTGGEDLVNVDGGNLDLGGPLLSVSGDSPVVTLADDVLDLDSTVTGPVDGSVFSFSAGTLSADELVDVSFGSSLLLEGPLMTLEGGTISLDNVLNLADNLTTAAEAPFLDVNGGDLNTSGNLAFLNAEEATIALSLQNSFLSQSGGTVAVGTPELPADAIAVNGNTLESVAPFEGAAAPVFDLNGGELNVSQHLVALGGGTLNLEGPLLATSDAADVNVAGDILNIASDVNGPSLGSLFDVAGGSLEATNLLTLAAGSTLDLVGAILNQSGGAINVTDVLNFQAPVSGPEAPLLQVNGGNLTATGSLLVLGANLILQGPVLSQTDGEIEVGTAIDVDGGNLTGSGENFFDLQGGTFTVNDSFLNVESGSVLTEGDLFTIDGALPFTLNGSLLSQIGGTVEAENIINVQTAFSPATSAPLLQVDGGSLTANDSILVLGEGADLDLEGPVLTQTAGNITADTAVKVAGGSLTGNGLDFFELLGGTFTVNDSVLKVESGSVFTEGDLFTIAGELPFTLNGSLLSQIGGTVEAENIINVQAAFAPSSEAPLLQVDGGSLTANDSLLVLGADLNLQGPFLSQTDGDIEVGTAINVAGGNLTGSGANFFELLGGTFTVNDSFLNVESGSVLTEGDLFIIGALPFTLNGSLLSQTGGTVEVNNLVDLQASFATTADFPFIQIDGGTLTTAGSLATLSEGGESDGTTLTLRNSFLSQSGGILTVGSAESMADALTIGPHTVDSTATTEPVFRFSGGAFNGSRHLVSLEGGELSLGGPLAILSGETETPPIVNLTGDALNIASTVIGPSEDPLFLIEDGLLSADDLVELASGSSLALTDRLLEVRADGNVSVVNDILNLGANLTTPGGTPLIHVTESGALAATGSLVDMGANLLLGDSLLSQTGGTVVVVEDAVKVGNNTLTTGEEPVFSISGGQYSGAGLETAMASVDGGVLELGSPIAVVSNGANVDLAGGFLRASNATVDTAEEFPQNLLVVEGAGTSLGAGTAPLFSFNPSEVFAQSLLNVMGGATLDLDDALLTDLGSDFFLQDGATITGAGSTLNGTGTDALFQTNDSLFVIGGEESEEPIPGDLLRLGNGATANIAGPLLDDSGSTFDIIGRLLGIDATSTFVSASPDPLIQLNETNLLVTDDVIQVNSDESLSVAGGLLSDVGGTINAGVSVLGINDGTVTGTGPNPLFSFAGTSLETQVFDIVAMFGGTLSAQGPLVVADNSSLSPDDSILFTTDAVINSTGTTPFIQILNESTVANADGFPLIDLGDGEVNLAGGLGLFQDSTVESQERILSIEGTDVNATGTDPLLAFLSSVASSLADFIGIDGSEESVNLDGPLGRFESSEITSDGGLVSVVDSTVTGAGEDAFLSFQGSTVSTQDTVFGVDASSVELDGPLVSANDTTFAVADAPVPPDGPIVIDTTELFLGVGPDASLLSTTTDPLITLSGGNGEIPALSANALAGVFENSNVELAGPLVTSDSDINVNAVLAVGFSSSLSSNSSEPLLQFSDGTVNAFGAFAVIFGDASVNLAGPLAEISDADDTINAGRFLFVSEFSDLIGISQDPFITVTEANVNTNDFTLIDNDAVVELGGPFVDASNSTFVVGLTNVSRFIEIQDGAQVFGPGKPEEGDAPAFINLDHTTVATALDPETGITRFLDVRRTGGEENPSILDLEGPFLAISNSTVTTLADFARVTQLAEVTSTAETAFIQSQNNTFNIGVDQAEEDPAQDNFFRVDNFSSDGVLGPASVSLAGPLLTDTGSTFTVAEDFLRVQNGSTLISTTSEPLITLNGSNVSTADRFLRVQSNTEPGSTLALDGPFLHATDTVFEVDTNEDNNAFAVVGGGSHLSSTTDEPLITLDTGSQVTGPIIFFRVRSEASTEIEGALVHDSGSTYDTGRFLRIEEDASLTSTSPDALIHLDASTVDTANDFAQIISNLSRVEVSGTLVHAENSTLNVGTEIEAPGDFLQVSGGAQLEMNSNDPVLLFDGGTVTVGTDDETSTDSPNHLVLLQGRTAQEGTDQPVIGNGVDPPAFDGAQNPVGSLVEARNGADIRVESGLGDSSGGNAIRLDTALLEASLPIVHLIGGEEAVTSLTTAQDAIFTDFGQITSLGPLVALDKSVINVTNGALLTLKNGSTVNVQGDLLKLINASRITIVNGPLILADGVSTLDVAGALVNFGGTGNNLIEVNNQIAPDNSFPGNNIPVATATGGSVFIGEVPVVNPGLGSIEVNGISNANQSEFGYTGSLIQSINNSTVNITGAE